MLPSFLMNYPLDSCRLTLALEQRRHFGVCWERFNTYQSAEKFWNRQGTLSKNERHIKNSRRNEPIEYSSAHYLWPRPTVLLWFCLLDPWKKRLCSSSVESLQLSDWFSSTVGISPSLADVLLLVPTRAVARFQYMQELHRRANSRSISTDMIILFARSFPTEMDTVHRHASDDDTPAKRTTYGNFPFNPLEHM